MKQLTKNLLKLRLSGVDMADVAKVEFAFSQNVGSTPLKLTEYPGPGVIAAEDGNVLCVIWTPEETLLFEAGRPFYVDTRITLASTTYQPTTPIVRLRMDPTLFEEEAG